MPSGSFVLHRIHQFPDKGTKFQTEAMRPPGSKDWQTAPVYTRIELRRRGLDPIAGFDQAQLLHRSGLKVHGYFHKDTVREIVTEVSFPAFYRRRDGLFFSHAPRATGRAALLSLTRHLSDAFRFKPLQLDLERLVDERPNTSSIVGIWVARKERKAVRSEALFGPAVHTDDEFERASSGGRLSSVGLLTTFKDKPVRVSVSRYGSAIFRGEHSLGLCLSYLRYLSTFEATKS